MRAPTQTASHKYGSDKRKNRYVGRSVCPKQPVCSESAEGQSIELNHIEDRDRHNRVEHTVQGAGIRVSTPTISTISAVLRAQHRP